MQDSANKILVVDDDHRLRDLLQREERLEVLPNELAAVQAFMAANINA